MKQNYDIRFNQDEPSDEQIRSHMDFDALLEKAEQKEKPIAKRVSLFNRALIGGAVAATFIGVIFFIQNNNSIDNNYTELANNHFLQQEYINPPIEKIEPQFISYNLNADAGGSIDMKNNATINVPPSAFQDEAGNSVSGNINIRYRSMDNSNEYFLSGIPMYYDSLGNRYGFESNRLFEIYAEKEGKRLVINPEKGMEVSFESKENAALNKKKPNSFNVYQLDNNKRNWFYQGQSNSSFEPVKAAPSQNSIEQQIESEYRQKIQAIETDYNSKLQVIQNKYQAPSLPIKPVKFDPEKIVFDFDLNEGIEENEITSSLKRWQPKGSDSELQKIANVEWFEDEVNLVKVADGIYKMTFNNGKMNVEIDAVPVLSGPEFQAALNNYENKLKEAQTKINTFSELKKAEVEALNQKLNEEKNNALKERNDKKSNIGDHHSSNANKIVERAVKNVFTINELGIWNCDNIINANEEKRKIICLDEQGNKITNTTLYHADLNRNNLNKYFLGEFAEIRLSPNASNQFWIINNKRFIAVAYPKEINIKEEETSITLKVVRRKIESENDVYTILKLGKSM